MNLLNVLITHLTAVLQIINVFNIHLSYLVMRILTE